MSEHSEKAAIRGEPSYVWRSGQDRRMRMVEQWVKLDGRVLDFGCGLGAYTERFKLHGGTVIGFDVEEDRVAAALSRSDGVCVAVGENLPFCNDAFDTVFSNEVIEHVLDDRQSIREMVRITRPGGRIFIFCPNRWYPVEQHGIYWRGEYIFGNIPLVNYLPNFLRDRLAPHVRTYSRQHLMSLFDGLPVNLVHYTRIFGGYDNIERRLPYAGSKLKRWIYALEPTPFNVLGLSHVLVMEKK